MKLIDLEFAMYKHHYAPNPSHSCLGFLRIMFFSIIQQILRQDPVVYAMMVAGRPDHNFRLIGYPYITKYAAAGDNTGFEHLDIDLEQLVLNNKGENMLTSSISLDDEEKDGNGI